MAFFQPTFTNNTSVTPGFQSDPFISGLSFTWLTATTFMISPGVCRAYGNDFVMALQAPVVVDTTLVGLNGCFPLAANVASPTNDTNFGIYLVADSTGVLGSVGGNSPKVVIATGNNFLPTGYQVWRRIGSVLITGGTNNMPVLQQTGSGIERKYSLQVAYSALTGGTDTAAALIDLSATNGPLNPNFTDKVFLQAVYTPGNIANILSFSPSNATSSVWPQRIQANVVSVPVIESIEVVAGVVAGNAAVYYFGGAADSTDVYLGGWSESLGLQAV